VQGVACHREHAHGKVAGTVKSELKNVLFRNNIIKHSVKYVNFSAEMKLNLKMTNQR
jgi:hypothetical protein